MWHKFLDLIDGYPALRALVMLLMGVAIAFLFYGITYRDWLKRGRPDK